MDKNYYSDWQFLRKDVAAADSALTTFDSESWPTSNTYNRSHYAGYVKLCAYLAGTDGGTAACKLYGRIPGGPIQRIATLTFTLDSTNGVAVTKTPVSNETDASSYWADTITVANATETVSGSLSSGQNEISHAIVKMVGYQDLYLQVDTLTNITSFSAVITESNLD